jgi:hypothetical protein
VGNERAVTADIGTEKHRKMAGERSSAVMGDESGEALSLNKRSEFAGVLNSESGWNIHIVELKTRWQTPGKSHRRLAA